MRQDFENKMKLAQTTLSRRDSLKIARRFNAGNGFDCASSPAGTAENIRQFRPSLRDLNHFTLRPGVETPGYCRSSLRDKMAARSGKLRRSDLFVENRSAQDSKLRRSGISGGASVPASRENCLAHVGSRRRSPHRFDFAPTDLGNDFGARLKRKFSHRGRGGNLLG